MLFKSCLVTGVNGAIGAAIASAYSSEGYEVIGLDIHDYPIGAQCKHYIKVDLNEYVKNENFSREINILIKDFLGDQGLHVLINNAAIQNISPIELMDRAKWQDSLNVNLLAPFFISQALLRELEKAQGCIINISSIHAKLTKKYFSNYAVTKAALSALTRSMAIELGSLVRINAIEPAAIDTPMLHQGFSGNKDRYNRLNLSHPTKRIGTSDEVAKLCILISESGVGFLNGACIQLDGGIGAVLHDPAAG